MMAAAVTQQRNSFETCLFLKLFDALDRALATQTVQEQTFLSLPDTIKILLQCQFEGKRAII